jgi:hypothetical protein
MLRKLLLFSLSVPGLLVAGGLPQPALAQSFLIPNQGHVRHVPHPSRVPSHPSFTPLPFSPPAYRHATPSYGNPGVTGYRYNQNAPKSVDNPGPFGRAPVYRTIPNASPNARYVQIPDPSVSGYRAAKSATQAVWALGRGNLIGAGRNVGPALRNAHDAGVGYSARSLPPTGPTGYLTPGQQGIPVYGGLKGR